MPRALVSWSDRGVSGPRPAHQQPRPDDDRGPVMRFVCAQEAGHYQRALILSTEAGKAPAQELICELREHIPTVELQVHSFVDPSDYEAIFSALKEDSKLNEVDGDLEILLSAGTPQMQTLWVIMVQAGLLPARMFQVIPAAFVPSIHPHPVREVNLDLEGFPEIRALREEVLRLRAHSHIFGRHVVGESEVMRTLLQRVSRVGPSDLPVVIQGETGSGKELIARAVHESSHRAAGPLIAENCGALTESVLASELFGHEKGAFTGAAHRKRGLFEMASGGTLFLDEIAELSPRMQVSLLRVLQEGSLRRLGSEDKIKVDVRVVAATHRDLAAMVREGSFREDLFYRLQGALLLVPPLRDRKGDLRALVAHFLEESGAELRVTKEAWVALQAYPWPGNVRELRAEVMRWQVFCDRWVRPEDLSLASTPAAAIAPPLEPQASSAIPLSVQVEATERRAIETSLSVNAGNLSRTARDLAIDRNTLKRKIRRLEIERDRLPPGRPQDDWS